MEKEGESCKHVWVAQKKCCLGWIEYRVIQDGRKKTKKEKARMTKFRCKLCGQISPFPNYLDHIYTERGVEIISFGSDE